MKKTTLALSILAVALAGTGCSKKAATNKDGSAVVTIGLAGPLTGAQSHLGKDDENGAKMAIEDLNAQKISIAGKPVTFELISTDDMADARTATTVAQQLVDKKVNGVIGHMNSSTTLPASRIYHDNKLVQISPSATNPTYTHQGFNTAFRIMANDIQQGKVLGMFAVKDLGAKKIAVIDDKTAYGSGLATEFEKAVTANGGTLIGHEYTTDKETDFNSILTRIKGLNPDLIFFGGMDGQGAAMVQQIHNLGIPAKFMGGDGIHTAEFMKLAGGLADGMISSLPGSPIDKMPKGAEFKKRYNSAHGDIQLYAPYYYDGVMVLVDAMKRANSTDPTVYIKQMPSTNYAGVTNTITFDANGDLNKAQITLYTANKGVWQPIKTVD